MVLLLVVVLGKGGSCDACFNQGFFPFRDTPFFVSADKAKELLGFEPKHAQPGRESGPAAHPRPHTRLRLGWRGPSLAAPDLP